MAEQVAEAVHEAAPELQMRVRVSDSEVSAEDWRWADVLLGFRLPSAIRDQYLDPEIGADGWESAGADNGADGVVGPRWYHSMSDGVDPVIAPLRAAHAEGRSMTVTHTVGRMPEAIGVHVLAWLLDALLEMPHYRHAQAKAEWIPTGFRRPEDWNVVILGTGKIGAGVAKEAEKLGFNVVGLSGSGRKRPGFSTVFALRSDDGSLTAEATQVLAKADAVIGALPATEQTENAINAEVFAALDGAVVINVGRGSTLDPHALREALGAQSVARAYLDVMEMEPLPAADWRWADPRVTLTPHISGPTQVDDILGAFLTSRDQLLAGTTPDLIVDIERGY